MHVFSTQLDLPRADHLLLTRPQHLVLDCQSKSFIGDYIPCILIPSCTKFNVGIYPACCKHGSALYTCLCMQPTLLHHLHCSRFTVFSPGSKCSSPPGPCAGALLDWSDIFCAVTVLRIIANFCSSSLLHFLDWSEPLNGHGIMVNLCVSYTFPSGSMVLRITRFIFPSGFIELTSYSHGIMALWQTFCLSWSFTLLDLDLSNSLPTVMAFCMTFSPRRSIVCGSFLYPTSFFLDENLLKPGLWTLSTYGLASISVLLNPIIFGFRRPQPRRCTLHLQHNRRCLSIGAVQKVSWFSASFIFGCFSISSQVTVFTSMFGMLHITFFIIFEHSVLFSLKQTNTMTYTNHDPNSSYDPEPCQNPHA